MQIASNSMAQIAVNALHAASSAQATASERISTGLRVNRASDDPVGMMVGNRLKTQITSLAKAIENVNQGVAMTQIVDSSLTQMVDLLGYMRVSAVAAEAAAHPALTAQATKTRWMRMSTRSTAFRKMRPGMAPP